MNHVVKNTNTNSIWCGGDRLDDEYCFTLNYVLDDYYGNDLNVCPKCLQAIVCNVKLRQRKIKK